MTAPSGKTATMSAPARWMRNRRFFVPLHRVLFAGVSLGSARVPGAASEDSRSGGIPGVWIRGFGRDKGPVVLFFHGGGYMAGSAKTHVNGVAYLCREAGAHAFLPEYRRTPGHAWPAAVDDAAAAYQGLLDQGIPPERIAVCGDSAGGGLALALMVRARTTGLPLPAALVLFSPWVDLDLAGRPPSPEEGRSAPVAWALEALAGLYAGGADPKNPEISPIYADLSGFPPTLLMAGDREIMAPDARRLAARARDCRANLAFEPYPGGVHVLPFFTRVSAEGRALLARAGRFVRDHAGPAI